MPRELLITPSRTTLISATGNLLFDTDAFPVSYAPESDELLLTGQVITFPDVRKGFTYQWERRDIGISDRDVGACFITMVPQDWGPASMTPAPTDNLDEIVLGTVPELADHILVQVNLTRTSNPSTIHGETVPVFFKEGAWTTCDGGDLLVEFFGPLKRILRFYLAPLSNGDGTRNVIMRRTMSTFDLLQDFYRTDNDTDEYGWTWGGTYGSMRGIPVFTRDINGPAAYNAGAPNKFRIDGSNAASTNDTSNYTSVYTGDIRIIPGYAGIAPVHAGGDMDGPFPLYLGHSWSVDANTTTFDDWIGGVAAMPAPGIVSLGDEHPTRRVIISIAAYNNSTSDRSITSVTINGITAVQKLSRQGDDGGNTVAVAQWIAGVPTGASLSSLVITTNGNCQRLVVEMWSVYNLASDDPVASISSNTWSQAQSLVTPSGQSVVIGIAGRADNGDRVTDPALRWMDGLDIAWLRTSAPTPKNLYNGYMYSAGYQIADGETLSIQVNTASSNTSGGSLDWLVGCWQ